MDSLQRLSIGKKVTRVILLTCTVVLVLACGILAAYELFDFQRTMARDMAVLADVMSKNTVAAITFQDEAAARETLSALRVEPQVTQVCLYLMDGTVFAAYARASGSACPRETGVEGHNFRDGRLALVRPLLRGDKRIGTIYLEASLQGMYERLQLFGVIAGAVLLGSLAVALALGSRLQRPISEPILNLAWTARQIAVGKDYSVRAAGGDTKGGTNEVGVLTEAFNQMLRGIEEREAALRATNAALTIEVSERQRAEERAQSQLARLQLLNQVTRAIGERQDLQSIFQVVITSLEDHLPVDFCCTVVHDPKEKALTILGMGRGGQTIGSGVGLSQGVRIDVNENSLARCLEGRLIYEPNISESEFPFPKQLAAGGLKGLVLAPLLVEKDVLGILVAARREQESFSSVECEFIRQVSEHAALAARHADLYTALQAAYEDLRQSQQSVMQQERLRALGGMASGIAHDINNAISPAALYTEFLLENEPGLSAKGRNYLGTIQHAIDDVAHTVAQMREFYRHREPQLQLSPVQLNQMVPQVVDLSRARWSDMALQKGVVVSLATELDAAAPAVLGIESEIREALVNLIFNAVDAMPTGGALTVRTRVDPGGPARPRVMVEVSDTGMGMDEETRRRCLEPFFTTKGERGTGLGLAMVYGVVQRHNAALELDSVPGQGTTARIVFDVPMPADEAAPAPLAPVAPSRLKLLLVDDDPLVLDSLRDALENDGHQIRIANGGQAGIDAFGESVASGSIFDAVITDLGMPYVDGRKVSEAVKTASASTPVVLLTGWGQRLVAEGDVPPHVDFVLSKPPKLKELRETLAACMARPLSGGLERRGSA